jgi:hypothetical protein
MGSAKKYSSQVMERELVAQHPASSLKRKTRLRYSARGAGLSQKRHLRRRTVFPLGVRGPSIDPSFVGRPVHRTTLRRRRVWDSISEKGECPFIRSIAARTSAGPISLVNEPLSEDDLADVRKSVKRGRPFGGPIWTRRLADRPGLALPLNERGRPKPEDKR